MKHYPSSHATVVYGEVPRFTFYIQHSASCQHKNIASAEEGPSWALICIIQLLIGV